ncbi:MAG: hypothetical protein ACREKE_06680 [bacterium]
MPTALLYARPCRGGLRLTVVVTLAMVVTLTLAWALALAFLGPALAATSTATAPTAMAAALLATVLGRLRPSLAKGIGPAALQAFPALIRTLTLGVFLKPGRDFYVRFSFGFSPGPQIQHIAGYHCLLVTRST